MERSHQASHPTSTTACPVPASGDKQSNFDASSDKCIDQTETIKTSDINRFDAFSSAGDIRDPAPTLINHQHQPPRAIVESDVGACVTVCDSVVSNKMPLPNGMPIMFNGNDGNKCNSDPSSSVVDPQSGGDATSVKPDANSEGAAGDGIWDQSVPCIPGEPSVVLSNNDLLVDLHTPPLREPCASFGQPVAVRHSVSGLLGLSGGKTLNDVNEEDEDDDDDDDDEANEPQTTQNEDIKALLVGQQPQRKNVPTRGIVKSPSIKSIGPDTTAEITPPERPVLHVKFHPNGGSSSMYPGAGDTSPASSVSSTSSSSSDDEESSSGQYSETKPPDGGWGWVVVFASFIVNLIADGITFSFGVIYVEFLNYFGEGRGKTAWIGSLFMAMPLLSGPIASFLTDRYGCRKVTIAGSILACVGFVLSAFSSSMEMLFFTFGIVSGFGLSLCYVAAVVIVAYYFDKRRSFATGLSVCGSGIGTFIFAPLTQLLIEHYGWRGTTLILAGFFLNMCVCGMLMRDLEWTTHRAKLKAKQRKTKNKLGISADSFSVSNSTNTGGTASNLNQVPFIGGMDAAAFDKIDPTAHPRMFSSLITFPTFIRNGEKIPPEVLELMSSNRNPQTMHPTLSHSRSFSEPLSTSRLSELALSPPEGALSPTNPERQRFEKAKSRQIQNEQAFMTWLRRDGANNHPHARDAANRHPTTAYLKDLKMHRHSLTYRGAMLNINRYRLRASSCPDIYRNSMTTIAKEKFKWGEGIQDLKNVFADMLDFSYFADIRFLLFAVSNFFLYTWYDVPYVYLADYAVGLKISVTDASMLISAIGIVNMFGEIFLGWCGDKKFLTAGMIYAICMGLCGIVTACVPLLKSFVGLSFISGLFGLFIAANYALTSIILVELITIDRFTNAYGLLLLVQGIANLVGPPAAGWITDVTGNYDLAFYVSGFFIAVSGGLMFILPVQSKIKKHQALKRQKNDTRESLSNNQIRDDKLQNDFKTHIFADCFGKNGENPV